jgi:HD-GYP domain-containing protein (c-di-GMP phosphodiesterase class II)
VPLRLAEVLGCLSLGTDLSLGLPFEKAMRTAVIAVALADALGASPEERAASYYAALVRFVGCSAFAPEEAARYSPGDDNQLRHVLAYVEPGNPVDFASNALRGIGRGAPLRARAAALGRLLTSPRAPEEHSHAQCEVGSAIARAMGLGEMVVASLALRDERYDGRGPLRKAAGDALPLAARVADVADIAELFHGRAGVAGAIELLEARRGGQLDPDIVAVFLRDPRGFLAPVEAPSVVERFLACEGPSPRVIDAAGLEQVAAAFSRAIDLKSYYTPGHSAGVAALAGRAAEAAGLDADGRHLTTVAALLHDLGNLGVPTGLLDKPAALTRWEQERVRTHAHHTAAILRASPALAEVAAVAGAAHEYGPEGYPRGVGHASLPLAARIVMAADVHHALREPRAHRPARSAAEAERALRDLGARGRLCGQAVRGVLDAAGAAPRRKGAWPRGLSDREVEVLRLAALGRTYAEVGALLGVSPRTAQRHVMNVYDKVGVSSRAALALFAVDSGLLDPA